MKVLTLNTHSWLEAEPLEKLTVLAAVIAAEGFDVIALQEVNQLAQGDAALTDDYYQPAVGNEQAIFQDNFALCLVQELQKVGCRYYWSWAACHLGYQKYHEGVALLSKTPIQAEVQLVSQGADFADFNTRKLLWGHTQVEGRSVTVASVHYSWWQEEGSGFAYEWQQTQTYLSNEPRPVVLLGDFNNPASREGEGYQEVSRSLTDVFGIAENKRGEFTVQQAIDGWSANRSALRIDYVFVSPGVFTVADYQIIFDGQNQPVVSDHFGIAAILNFTEPAKG